MNILLWFFQLIQMLLGNSPMNTTTSSSTDSQSVTTSSDTQTQNNAPMDGSKIALVGDSWASGMKTYWKLGDVYAYPGKSWSVISQACAQAATDGYKNIVVWCGVNGYSQKPAWHTKGVISCCNNAPNSNLWFFNYAKQKKVKTARQNADPNMEAKIRANVLPGIKAGVEQCKNAKFTDLSDREYPLNISKETPVNGVYKHDGFHLTGAGFKQLADDIMSIIKGGK